ncbi:hypothetical protein [Cecembia calidifontis]|nr:hypothetical protein [Cecembia calidifontis]
MKTAFLFPILTVFFVATAFAQTGKQMIDVEYDFFGSVNQYSVGNKNLFHKDLKIIFENYPEPKVHFDKATKRKKVATPLLSIGGAGVITSFFLRTTDAGGPMFWSSFGVFMLGTGYYQGYRVNVQRAVNTYNQEIFRSERSRGSLDLKISPLQSGLIYSF